MFCFPAVMLLASFSEVVTYVLVASLLILPVAMGIVLMITGGRVKCRYCKSRISASASACPACRRSNLTSYGGRLVNSRSGRFWIGLFATLIAELLILAGIVKLFT